MGVTCANETVSTSNIIFAETKEDIRISDRIKKEGKFCKGEFSTSGWKCNFSSFCIDFFRLIVYNKYVLDKKHEIVDKMEVYRENIT